MEPLSYTVPEACKRHAGLKADTLRLMCQRNQIRATKVGACWHIPAKELDLMFLGKR